MNFDRYIILQIISFLGTKKWSVKKLYMTDYIANNKKNLLSVNKEIRTIFYDLFMIKLVVGQKYNFNNSIKHLKLKRYGYKLILLYPSGYYHGIIDCTYVAKDKSNGCKYTEIPENIISLTYSSKCPHIINRLPQNLETSKLAKYSNQKIDNLPQNFKYLYCGTFFNQKVDNLPKNLQYVEFSNAFNRHVNNLPESLETLIFGDAFNLKIDKYPNSLKYLKFGKNYSFDIVNLPNSLETLKLDYGCRAKIIHFPPNLKEIYTGTNYWHSKELKNKIKQSGKKIKYLMLW